MKKYDLVEGREYWLEVDQYPHNGKAEKVFGRFVKSFPCYDARVHGATSDCDDYIAYQFSYADEKRGVFSYYQKQIHSVFDFTESQEEFDRFLDSCELSHP